MLSRSVASLALLVAIVVSGPASAQAPQFRADVRQTGDTPFTGTMYVGATRMRIEGTSNGEQMTMIIDSDAGTITMVMADQQAYMTMDAGSLPFAAPSTRRMDPANPCSSGEVTECESLGTQTINGYSARGWEYTRDGMRESGWIATDLRFPVRMIDGDGNQSDFTNITMGPQPASLFEPPAGYTAMDMGGLFGGRGDRGMARGGPPPGAAPGGRGAGAPSGAPAAVPPGGLPPGIDPAMLAGLGLDAATIAQVTQQMNAMGTVTNSAPWEQGDGWVADLVVTASVSNGGELPLTGGSFSSTYTARYTASVPFTYGTPAVGAAIGPAWQLVATAGSPRGLAEPVVFSGTTQYHEEGNSNAQCPIADAGRYVSDGQGSVQLRTADHNSVQMMSVQARWEISGDLRTHHLMVGVGATGTETITTVSTSLGVCGGSPSTETDTQNREPAFAITLDLPNLPLSPNPTTMRGTATATMPFDIAGSRVEAPAQVEWTLRPIS